MVYAHSLVETVVYARLWEAFKDWLVSDNSDDISDISKFASDLSRFFFFFFFFFVQKFIFRRYHTHNVQDDLVNTNNI